MPEIGEVARIVHYIKQHLVGKTLAVVKAQHDENVFGKVGTSAAEFEKALKGKKVVDAGQQGKYFWLIMSSPPHPVCHFGMAGWFKIRGVETAYYKPTKPVIEEWPPKYWKFCLETAPDKGQSITEAAFVDFRRFARVRLIDCPGNEIRNVSPLKENGPDPVIDREILTQEWLVEKCKSKRIPIKALLLDQANISGIGNWVGDEILYDARIHPEQYSNTLSDSQLTQLHTSIIYVTSLAVETKSDSSLFPATWLFKHRWGKGKKDSTNKLPNGAKIVFVTVGGRTSAVVPSVQKKTGPVAGDVKPEDEDGDGDGEKVKTPKNGAKATKGKGAAKATTRRKKRAQTESEDDDDDAEISTPPDSEESDAEPVKPTPKGAKRKVKAETVEVVEKVTPKSRKRKAPTATNGVDQVEVKDEEGQDEAPAGKKVKASAKKGAVKKDGKNTNGVEAKKENMETEDLGTGNVGRRSGRISNGRGH